MVELSLFVCLFFGVCRLKSEKHVYMYKQGWISIHKKYKACQCKCKHMEGKSSKSTRHVNANVNIWKENEHHQNSSKEVEDVILKGHPMPQMS
jgi:hypothetical protein